MSAAFPQFIQSTGKITVLTVASITLFAGHARGDEPTCPAGMVQLPAGSYTSQYKQKKPATVGAFCLDVLEVTVEQYAACVKSGKCAAIPKGDGCNTTPGRKDHPANCVDWSQANAYCAAQGKRLPTVDEWEWAARGAAAGTKFPWGAAKPKAQGCWYKKSREVSEDTPSQTCAVAKVKGDVTPQGVRGLAGNVSEWTSTPGFNPEKQRFLAGGSASSTGVPDEVSASARIFYAMTERGHTFGIRCAK